VQIEIGDYNAGTFTTPPAGNGNAVRAKVRQQQPPYMASLLGVPNPINIPGQAVAVIEQPTQLCALSLGPDPNQGTGALKLGGNSSGNGQGCPMMSDYSVQLASTPTFTGSGWAVLGATGCSPSASACASVTVPHNWYMPFAVDPLQNLKTESFNTMPAQLTMTGTGRIDPTAFPVPCSNFSALSPPPPANVGTCYWVKPNTASSAYNKDLNAQTPGGHPDYFAFVPAVPAVPGASGTYFFNANIKNTGGTIVFGGGTYYVNGTFSGGSGPSQFVSGTTPGTYYFYGAFSGPVNFANGTYYFYGNFSGGGNVDFAPGTYFFQNSAINFNGGNVTCNSCTSWASTGLGVTLVLLGNSSLSISGTTSVSLSAPVTNTTSSDLNGVLIDDQATGAVGIGGSGGMTFAGAMYFPNTGVKFSGTSQPNNTACSEVIAQTLDMTGGAYLSTTGCNPNTVAHTQMVHLVQ
jgi:hypothetical protein